MARTPRQPLHKRLHDYFLPHARNNYRPHFFGTRSLTVVVAALLVLEGLYFAQTKLVFERTNFLASVLPAALVDLTNGDRETNQLGTVTTDPVLTQVAQQVADDMAARGYFAHVSPDGKTPWYWLKQAGYSYSYAGQNLAVDFTDSKDVENAWLNSPTHRANLLKSQYTRIGIAVANGTYQGHPATFVVQYFATPKAQAQLPKATVSTAAGTPRSSSTPLKQAPKVAITREANVLGAEVGPDVAQTPPDSKTHSLWLMLATSPHHILMALLAAAALITLALLLIALLFHARVRYVEVLGGGLLILLVIVALLAYTSMSHTQVSVPYALQQSLAETSEL